jgi:hypothetical protein
LASLLFGLDQSKPNRAGLGNLHRTISGISA